MVSNVNSEPGNSNFERKAATKYFQVKNAVNPNPLNLAAATRNIQGVMSDEL